MKKIILIAIAVSAAVSCQSLREEFQPVGTLHYQNPPAYRVYSDKDFAGYKHYTIAELAASYTPGESSQYVYNGANAYISGRVSSNDQPGNFYKSLFIQDETGGMEIKIGKNALYNDFLPGQKLYVKLNGLTIGMYGYKDGEYGGMGMIQLGYSDPTGEYQTSYLETTLLIDTHIYRADPRELEPVTPVVVDLKQLPDTKKDTQASNKYVGALVTLKGLSYAGENFALMYLDPKQDRKSWKNRVFLSDSNTTNGDKTHNIKTWALSKSAMEQHLLRGDWDSCKVGSGKTFLQYKGQDATIGCDSLKIDKNNKATYPGVARQALSVSQYFNFSGREVQIRTSGFCKFSDLEIPKDILDGSKKINVTGVLSLYQGSIQLSVNSQYDFTYEDETPIYKTK